MDVMNRPSQDQVMSDCENVELPSSSNLQVICPQTRSKSPVSVQDWVAALPDDSQDRLEEDKHGEEVTAEENDNLSLGAEAGAFVNSSNVQEEPKRKHRVGVLQHMDTLASVTSDVSQVSSTSVDSLLQSREADPETVLQNLGFAGSEALAKIPARFLQQPSKAKGITVEAYKKQQDELIERFESGFFGYRGLQGSLHRQPSQLVEKILQALKEKELKRKGSAMSWCSQLNAGTSSIPSRFKRMDPERPTFDSLVTQISKAKEKEKPKTKCFKSLAKSVLSPENRVWREEQIETNKRRATQLLIMGGKSFLVDDEGNEEEVVKRDHDNCNFSPMQRKLTKQDSLQSLQSNSSFDSDWSDEENGELEKKFGGMSNRSVNSDKADPMKSSFKRSRSRKSNSQTPPWFEPAQLVYSRESSSCTSEVDEGVLSFTKQCIPEEGELDSNIR